MLTIDFVLSFSKNLFNVAEDLYSTINAPSFTDEVTQIHDIGSVVLFTIPDYTQVLAFDSDVFVPETEVSLLKKFN